MQNKTRALVTMILVVALVVTTFFAVLRRPAASLESDGSFVPNYASGLAIPETGGTTPPYDPNAQLVVYPAGGARTVSIGSYLEFLVERDGEIITYKDVSYEIVSGRDCAAIYYNGNLLGLGAGEVVVRAYLDVDAGVYGYGTVRVAAPAGPNRYTETRDSSSPLAASDAAFESAIADFPESYKPALRALHERYPLWQFRPFYTGQNFFEAVYQESIYNKSLTLLWNMADLIKSKAAGDYLRDSGQYILKDTGWVSVNSIPVAYHMDPRNFLDERSIFQFEMLHFDGNIHTLEGVEGILLGSFMSYADTSYLDTEGNLIASDITYAAAILEAGRTYNVNPYYLAAKIRQEIGSTPSLAATGTCPGYEGYYNFYNIGATDGEGNIQRGLDWASSGTSFHRPWTSPYKSIMGGAQVLAQDYIGVGQFTGYLQKFNVNPDADYGLYTHQYMTNISGAASQAMSAYAGYADIGALQSAIVFSIPVYNDMPGASAQSTSLSLSGNATAIMTHGATLRSGPAAFHTPVNGIVLQQGELVRVLRAVSTDARYYQSWLFFPVWYEVEVARGGVRYTGFVSEEFVRRGSAAVLQAGDTLQLTTMLSPGSDDVVRFLSENTNVATVSQDGVVVAQSRGTVNIVGYTSSGIIDCFTVTVT